MVGALDHPCLALRGRLPRPLLLQPVRRLSLPGRGVHSRSHRYPHTAWILCVTGGQDHLCKTQCQGLCGSRSPPEGHLAISMRPHPPPCPGIPHLHHSLKQTRHRQSDTCMHGVCQILKGYGARAKSTDSRTYNGRSASYVQDDKPEAGQRIQRQFQNL